MRYIAATVLTLACGTFAFGQQVRPALPGNNAPVPGTGSAALDSAGTPGIGSPAETAQPGATIGAPGTVTPRATVTPGTATAPGVAAPGTTTRPRPTTQVGPDAGATTPQTDRTDRRDAPRGDMAQNQGNQVQALAVHCLTLKNQNEIEAAKLANQKAQNQQVKEFAQMLQKDHQQALEQLASLRQDRQVRPDSARPTDRPATDRPEAAARRDNAARPQGNVVARLMDLEEQKAQNCAQMAREELTSKKGAEFDMCFVGHQIAGHMAMVAELKALKDTNTGSPEFQEWVSKATQTTEQHLEQAKQLAETLTSEHKDKDHAQDKSNSSNR